MSFYEGITVDEDFLNVRYVRQARQFRGIHDLVVSKVDPLERRQSLNSGQRSQPIVPQIQRGDRW